jgi:hypothetical protein
MSDVSNANERYYLGKIRPKFVASSLLQLFFFINPFSFFVLKDGNPILSHIAITCRPGGTYEDCEDLPPP